MNWTYFVSFQGMNMDSSEHVVINRSPFIRFCRDILEYLDKQSFIRRQICQIKRLGIDRLMTDELARVVFETYLTCDGTYMCQTHRAAVKHRMYG